MDRRETLMKEIREFKKNLNEKIPVQKMILFGSYAHGKPHRDSDIDLLIVSAKFRGRRSFKRSLGFYEYWTLNCPVDFLCYTPEEFNRLKKRATIVSEAVRNGIEIN